MTVIILHAQVIIKFVLVMRATPEKSDWQGIVMMRLFLRSKIENLQF